MLQPSKSILPYARLIKIPIWAQLAIGLVLIALIFKVSLSGSLYVSDWEEEDSNFYDAATRALQIFDIHPTAPTAFIFWENNCELCKKSVQTLRSTPPNLRIYGVHLTAEENSEVNIWREWLKMAPQAASSLIDREQLLQTAFGVRAVPEIFIYFPKQKKFFSYFGNIANGRKQMVELIKSESL